MWALVTGTCHIMPALLRSMLALGSVGSDITPSVGSGAVTVPCHVMLTLLLPMLTL
jgi:hypothetical protein